MVGFFSLDHLPLVSYSFNHSRVRGLGGQRGKRSERPEKVLRRLGLPQHDFTFSGTGMFLKQHLPQFFCGFCGRSPAVAPPSATPLAQMMHPILLAATCFPAAHSTQTGLQSHYRIRQNSCARIRRLLADPPMWLTSSPQGAHHVLSLVPKGIISSLLPPTVLAAFHLQIPQRGVRLHLFRQLPTVAFL